MKIETVKKLTRLGIGVCTGHVVSRALRNNFEPEGRREKIELAVGSYAIGAMFADKVDDWVNTRLDSLHEQYLEYLRKTRGEPDVVQSEVVSEDEQPTA